MNGGLNERVPSHCRKPWMRGAFTASCNPVLGHCWAGYSDGNCIAAWKSICRSLIFPLTCGLFDNTNLRKLEQWKSTCTAVIINYQKFVVFLENYLNFLIERKVLICVLISCIFQLWKLSTDQTLLEFALISKMLRRRTSQRLVRIVFAKKIHNSSDRVFTEKIYQVSKNIRN